jgi:hypothetical protein
VVPGPPDDPGDLAARNQIAQDSVGILAVPRD